MASGAAKSFRWGVERRLEFIESRLFWEDGLNRSDIVTEFGVSVPQASKDLALYQEQAPANIVYDRSEKRYFASELFCPRFIDLDAAAYLDRLLPSADGPTEEDVRAAPELAHVLPIPQRHIKPKPLRALLSAVRCGRSIEVLYQSMSQRHPEPFWRRLSPHAFASDGLRWHTRAYCHVDQKFKDFIVSRCLECRNFGDSGESAAADSQWNSQFNVKLIANPVLTISQQTIVEQDFAMVNGCALVSVRRAMLYYFRKRLRLDLAQSDPKETPVIVANRVEFDAALLEAMR